MNRQDARFAQQNQLSSQMTHRLVVAIPKMGSAFFPLRAWRPGGS